MENTLFYFYSTIPQVLAAIIALVFVLAFFKLQEYDKILNTKCTSFARILGNHATPHRNWQDLDTGIPFMTNYNAGYYKGISILMDKICNEREKDSKDAVYRLREITEETKKVEEDRKSIIANSKYLTIYVFSVITSSIMILSIVRVIYKYCNLVNTLFVIYSMLIIISLFWVYRILSISLRN